jgi:hypothetical protein
MCAEMFVKGINSDFISKTCMGGGGGKVSKWMCLKLTKLPMFSSNLGGPIH